MNEALFSKSFGFNFFKWKNYHATDQTKTPTTRHFFGCLVHGTAEIIAKNEKIEVKPGEVFYIPKGLKYVSHWYVDQDSKNEFYSFGFDFAPTTKIFALQKINCSEKAKQLFQELCQEVPMTDKGIGKLYNFFGEVMDGMKLSETSSANKIIEQATEYMTEHPNFKISEVATHCNISTSGIYYLFKKHLNKTPNDIRNKILCKKAVLLLTTTDKSVQEISDSLGFSSTSYFRKILKAYTNQTPREVRNNSKIM